MPEGYLHLTYEQRCQIYALLQSAHSQADIARQLGVTRSTVSRELARNAGARGYRFKQAHATASQRRQQASNRPRKMTPYVVALIERIMTQEQWSPEQIAGRLAQEGIVSISHETIYRHVWEDKKDGGNLYLHLRHNGKKYHKRELGQADDDVPADGVRVLAWPDVVKLAIVEPARADAYSARALLRGAGRRLIRG